MKTTNIPGNADIQGNANISRHANVGGDATVNGDVAVGHNLIVKGWVDAPNIKGTCKGLYASEETLRSAYPRPMPGWFALVGNTLPAQVWRVDEGKWLPTGETGGEFNLWLDQLQTDVKDLRSNVEGMGDLLSELDGLLSEGLLIGDSIEITSTGNGATMSFSIRKRDGGVTPILRPIPMVTEEKAGMMSAADKKELSTATTAIAAINASMGQPKGIATLDTSGKVPSTQLPGYVDDVIEFNAMVNGITTQTGTSSQKSTDNGCMVVYNRSTNTFVLAVSKVEIADTTVWDAILRPVKGGGKDDIIAPLSDTATFTDTFTDTVTSTDTVTDTVTSTDTTTSSDIADFWVIEDDELKLDEDKFTYYTNWADADNFGRRSTKGRIPDTGKIYTSTSDNKTFRWSGSKLVVIGNDLALGHTASTAFPGDEGESLKAQEKVLEGRVGVLEGMFVEVESEEELDRLAEEGKLDENKFYYVTEED